MIRKELQDITNRKLNDNDYQIQTRSKSKKLKQTNRKAVKSSIENQQMTILNDYYYLNYYIDDIYSYLIEREKIFHLKREESKIPYMKRAKILNWLYSISNCIKISNDTIYLTIALIDYPTSDDIDKHKYDLLIIGITKLMIASKIEDCIPIKLKDILNYSGIIDSEDNIKNNYIDIEKSLLNDLDFNVNIPTPILYLRHFMKIRYINNKSYQFSKLIIDIMLFIDKLRKHPYHLIAATSFCCSLDILNKTSLGENWTKSLMSYSKITKYQLIPVIKEFYNELIDQIENDFLTILFNRYRNILEPNILLLNIKDILLKSE